MNSSVGSVIVARKREDVKIKVPNCLIVSGASSLNEARNLGAARFLTDLIAFIDDDNGLDKDALDEMAKAFSLSDKIGVVSPVIFDRQGSVWFAGGRFNPLGMAKIDRTVPRGLRPTETFHDVFMVKREAFEKAGGFDSKRFPFYLGEADLAERLKRLGYHFFVVPQARVWHDIERGSITRNSHIRNEQRAYLVGRNRLLFLRLYRSRWWLHLFILPALAVFHILGMVTDRKFSFIRPYLKGIGDGLK